MKIEKSVQELQNQVQQLRYEFQTVVSSLKAIKSRPSENILEEAVSRGQAFETLFRNRRNLDIPDWRSFCENQLGFTHVQVQKYRRVYQNRDFLKQLKFKRFEDLAVTARCLYLAGKKR